MTEERVYEIGERGLHVYSWCPAPDPTSTPCTQVHLHIPMPDGVAVVRFKGPGTLDALIAALERHRVDVFGVQSREARYIAEQRAVDVPADKIDPPPKPEPTWEQVLSHLPSKASEMSQTDVDAIATNIMHRIGHPVAHAQLAFELIKNARSIGAPDSEERLMALRLAESLMRIQAQDMAEIAAARMEHIRG